MKIISLEDSTEYSVFFKKNSGDEAAICPACSQSRKKKNDKSLSWNHEKGVGHCFHCSDRFVKSTVKKKEYARPEWKNKTDLPDKIVKFFEKRNISQSTLKALKVSHGIEWMPKAGSEVMTIQFNYFVGGELVNIKYRGPNKDFKMHKDAELVPYNIDSTIDNEEVIIVEGEMDLLALYECGFRSIISVPNGGGGNISWLDGCIEYFADKTKIILATDQDNFPRHPTYTIVQRK